MTPEEMRVRFAAAALCGMLTKQISRDEIQALADGTSVGAPFIEAAWEIADRMMEFYNAPV